MNIYLRKKVFVEVQGQGRVPTWQYFPQATPHSLPTSKHYGGRASPWSETLLFSLVVCWRDAPLLLIYVKTPGHQHQEDKDESLAKWHMDGTYPGSGDPWGRPALWLALWSPPLFCRLMDEPFALSLGCWRFGTSVWPVWWALLVSKTYVRIFYVFFLCSIVFYLVFHL